MKRLINRRIRKRIVAFMFALIIAAGSISGAKIEVKAAFSYSSNGVVVNADNSTVEYDGKPHYPDINISVPSGRLMNVYVTVNDITYDDIPAFTEPGIYTYKVIVYTINPISKIGIPTITMNITLPDTGDEGTGDTGTGGAESGDEGTGDTGSGGAGTGGTGTGGTGTGGEGSGDEGTGNTETGGTETGGTETGENGSDNTDSGDYDAEAVYKYVMEQFDKYAFNSFDKLGSDKTYRIDCSQYKIPVSDEQLISSIYFGIYDNLFSDNYDNHETYDGIYDNYWFMIPDRFFVSGVTIDVNDDNNYVTSVNIKFVDDVGTQAEVATKVKAIDAADDDILSQFSKTKANGIDNSIDNFILSIHDGMCRVLDFAYADYLDVTKRANADLHTAEGVLANRKGLCDGYAYVFKYYMDRAKIPCRVLYSETLNHMWNQVYYNGTWYHIDVAWDDLVTTQAAFSSTFSNAADRVTMYGDYNSDYNDIGWVSHNYFMRNDDEMKSLGYSDWTYYYPLDQSNEETHPAVGTNTKYIYNSDAVAYKGSFSLIDNTWYSADATGTSKSIWKWNTINRRISDTKDREAVTLPVNVRYLTTDGTYLLYTDGDKSVYRSTTDGDKTWIYTPSVYGDMNLSEFAYKNGSLYTIFSSATSHNTISTSVKNSDSIWSEYVPQTDEDPDDNTGDGGNGDSGSGTSDGGSGSGTSDGGSGNGGSGSGTSDGGSGSSGSGTSDGGSGSSGSGTSGGSGSSGSGTSGGSGNGSSGSGTSGGGSNSGNSGNGASSGSNGSSDSNIISGGNDSITTGGNSDDDSASVDTSYEDSLDEGDEVVVGNATYEITENEDAREVAFTKNNSSNAASCTVPDTVTIGNTTYKVTEIAENAFASDSKLKAVKIGKYVTTIGDSAFEKCKSLKTVTLGSEVTVIGENAFKKDTALQKIVFPAKLKTINKNAFYQCSKLKSIQFKGKTAPTINKNAFKRIHKKAVFKVPSKSLKSYKKVLNSKVGVTKKMKVKK